MTTAAPSRNGTGGKTFNLASGASLQVSPAAFADAKALERTVLASLRGGNVGTIDLGKLKAAKESGNLAEAVAPLLDLILGAGSSKDLEDALFACSATAAYTPAGQQAPKRVTPGLFDEVLEARADYYQIMARVAEVNLGPFFQAIFSLSSGPRKEPPASPK